MASVFIMAAGKGTRLAPWTDAVPKPALPVANEPALGFLLRRAARAGYRRLTANASHLAPVLTSVIGDGSAHGVDLSWIVEDSPSGTIGGVLAAQDDLRDGDEPIIILSGDGVHDVDIAAVERTHRDSGARVTIAALRVADPSEYGVAVTDDTGRITGFQEKPAPGTEKSNLANTGIYVIQPDVLDESVARGFTDFGSELFPYLVTSGEPMHVHALEPATYWNDIGNLDEWRATCAAVLAGRVDVGDGPWNDESQLSNDQLLVHPTARIGDDVTLTGPCTVGAGAVVGTGAQLSSALVLPYANVPARTVIASGTIGTLDGLTRWARELSVT